MVKNNYKIPFEVNGNLISYPGYSGTYYCFKTNAHHSIVWEDNCKFIETFEYSGYSKGRSSCHIHLKSVSNGRQHFVMISDFDKMMKQKWMHNNQITGTFTFAKHGANFMMAPVFLEDQI